MTNYFITVRLKLKNKVITFLSIIFFEYEDGLEEIALRKMEFKALKNHCCLNVGWAVGRVSFNDFSFKWKFLANFITTMILLLTTRILAHKLTFMPSHQGEASNANCAGQHVGCAQPARRMTL